MQTSQAVDIVSGGVKINALPERVSAIVNHRVAVESTSDAVKEHLIGVVSQLLAKHQLSLDAWGTVLHNTSSSVGQVILEDFGQSLEPAPVSPLTTEAYKVFSSTIKQVFGDDVVVAPSINTGNTDTAFFWKLTRNIYRFTPLTVGAGGGVHTVDEHIGVKEHIKCISYYVQMMMNGAM